MSRPVTAEELDEILSHRDQRVRALVREEISASLGNGLGHAIRNQIERSMMPVDDLLARLDDRVDEVDRALYGDLKNAHPGIVLSVSEAREMVERVRWTAVAIKWLVPLIGVDVLSRFLPLLNAFTP